MTAKAALAKALLDGNVLTVMNCVRLTGLTNIAREIPRMIERPFKVEISRTRHTGLSRYGTQVFYFQYRLNATEYNEAGIMAMKEYVNKHIEKKQPEEFNQLELL